MTEPIDDAIVGRFASIAQGAVTNAALTVPWTYGADGQEICSMATAESSSFVPMYPRSDQVQPLGLLVPQEGCVPSSTKRYDFRWLDTMLIGRVEAVCGSRIGPLGPSFGSKGDGRKSPRSNQQFKQSD
jgi:hypothetical protein